MDKCPSCGADTRPGDNFCLNCGHRLLPQTPSPSPSQQAPTVMGTPVDYQGQIALGSGSGWVDSSAPTIAVPPPDLQSAQRESTSAPTAQATLDRIAQPARFVLRSESGESLQEYPLDKPEIAIGRAPTSDIPLSKDKLTSRRHATVRYENDQYYLYDEHSANGTFVNGQQMDDSAPYLLREGDHVGIGEHELVFYAFKQEGGIEDMPTRAVPFGTPAQELTFRTRDDSLATIPSSDEFGTRSIGDDQGAFGTPAANIATKSESLDDQVAEDAPSADPLTAPSFDLVVEEASARANGTPALTPSVAPLPSDGNITFSHLTSIPQPALPDMSPLMAALSTLDGQIMSLQEQFNATQDAQRSRDAELAKNANQLRDGIQRVSDRMDSTIADVARSREALAWAELLQLMEDVMNNPRDIEYVTKLARKARELNKVFQIYQNVLNTMAECNNQLRSMIGETN